MSPDLDVRESRQMSYSTRDLVEMMLVASRQLDDAQAELTRCVREDADAEYRKAKANAYLATADTVGEREAQVDKTVSEERKRAHLSDGLSGSALEAVRNRPRPAIGVPDDGLVSERGKPRLPEWGRDDDGP